ncbi:hypothetical protein [Roseibacillus persicicus]|uniref:hypothetical protein n=1 Tax=Roseibacillus persicicus TaxID=454148 RepID=UPI00280D7020|nr:hypothetical protein [Roseibacillus persicicus]MDQ8190508.1 hypothetical protein [Roseibacillus persicicus]
MKPLFKPALYYALLCSPLLGQDQPAPWNSVRFTVLHEEKKASVEIEGEDQLTKVVLTVDGKSFVVPETELAKCDLPQLDTANLLFGADWYGPVKPDEEKTPHHIIELTIGEVNKFGNHTSLKFLFHSGRFQERIILEQNTATLWKEYRKRVNEGEKETGTITRPAPQSGPSSEESAE